MPSISQQQFSALQAGALTSFFVTKPATFSVKKYPTSSDAWMTFNSMIHVKDSYDLAKSHGAVGETSDHAVATDSGGWSQDLIFH